MKTPRVTDFDPDAKVPSLKSSMDSMPVIEKPNQGAKPTPPVTRQSPVLIDKPAQQTQTSKTTNAQLTKEEKFDKYSTYLRPGYKKAIKTIALDRDCKDYEILDEAITHYLKSLKNK